jgi:hypothetical protein
MVGAPAAIERVVVPDESAFAPFAAEMLPAPVVEVPVVEPPPGFFVAASSCFFSSRCRSSSCCFS